MKKKTGEKNKDSSTTKESREQRAARKAAGQGQKTSVRDERIKRSSAQERAPRKHYEETRRPTDARSASLARRKKTESKTALVRDKREKTILAKPADAYARGTPDGWGGRMPARGNNRKTERAEFSLEDIEANQQIKVSSHEEISNELYSRPMNQTLTVYRADDGQRVDRWCKLYVPEVPYAALQKLFRKGLIRVDGKKVDASTRLVAGQEVTIRAFVPTEQPSHPREKAQHHLSAKQTELVRSWVLHKDKDMIIINKPYGLPVQGGTGVKLHVDGLLPALAFDMDSPPKLVHRLDRDTSGVLVLARTREAAARLQKGFAAQHIQKMYLALCMGVPERYEGEIHSQMEKDVRGKDSREVVVSGKEGKKAITRYKVIESLAKKFSLMELEPVTGRTHQLRVHMAEMLCPIVGDGKYGGANAFPKGTIAIANKLHLHAWRIHIPLSNGKNLRIVAPLPPHMKDSLKELNLDVEGM